MKIPCPTLPPAEPEVDSISTQNPNDAKVGREDGVIEGENETAPTETAAVLSPDEACALANEVSTWDLKDSLLAVLTVLACFYTIYFTRALLFPITLAVMLNLIFKPMVMRLKNLHIPSFVGAALIIVAFLGLIGTITLLLWEPATTRITEFQQPGYFERVMDKLEPLKKASEGIEKASKQVEEMTTPATPAGESEPILVQEAQRPLILSVMFNSTWSFLASAFVMFLLLYFLLAAGDRFLEKFVELMPTFHDKRRIVTLSREVQHQMSSYLFTISAINVGLGVVIGLGLWWIGLPNPAMWGVAATLLNYIPFLGLLIGSSLVFVVGLVSFDSLGHAALAPIIYLAANGLEANFITPALLGKSISLNPVMIILSIVFWGWLWGVGGVLLAVPLLATLKIFFDHSEKLAPLGAFLEK